jgi:exonuclease III
MLSPLKIASWNINSVRARLTIVEQFLLQEQPDILCLQETKVIDSDFPKAAFQRLGFQHIILCGQRMHHGVAILSRVPLVEESATIGRPMAKRGISASGFQTASGLKTSTYLPAVTLPTETRTPNLGKSSISSSV